MSNEEENTWNDIFNELDDLDSAIGLDEEQKPFELNEEFEKYFYDYCKIKYLEDIKEEDYYLVNKWKLIFYHCVQLDDYFFYLKKNYPLEKLKL